MPDCKFHDHKGDDPCPYCVEKGSTGIDRTALPFDQSTRSYRIMGRNAWADDCPECASTDLRLNATKRGKGAVWCGACGAQAELIDRTLGFIRSMRGETDVSYVEQAGAVQRSLRDVNAG